MKLRRLDAELVHRQLAHSRQSARQLIEKNVVQVNGIVCSKPTRQVTENDSITFNSVEKNWVSRGALKLLSFLEAYPELETKFHNAVVLDVGASTGGFSQVALQWAEKVIAVDVGYGQLAWTLRQDPKIQVLERTHINDLLLDGIETSVDIVLADVSFISLLSVIPSFKRLSKDDSTWILMVKPQFEVGKQDIGKGVVTDPSLHFNSVEKVVLASQDIGWGLKGVAASGLKGPKGNQEFFIWLEGQAPIKDRLVIQSEISRVTKGLPE